MKKTLMLLCLLAVAVLLCACMRDVEIIEVTAKPAVTSATPAGNWKMQTDFVHKAIDDKDGTRNVLIDLGLGYTHLYAENGDGTAYQELYFQDISNLAYAQEFCEFTDMNFDGYADFRVPQSDGDIIKYHSWLYDATQKTLIYHDELSALGSPSFSGTQMGGQVIVEEIRGVWGILKIEYSLNGHALERVQSFVRNAQEAANGLAIELYGVNASRKVVKVTSKGVVPRAGANGVVRVDGEPCYAFLVNQDLECRAVLAVSNYGDWYIDEYNTNDFCSLKMVQGTVVIGDSVS